MHSVSLCIFFIIIQVIYSLSAAPSCRFAFDYTADELLSSVDVQEKFLASVMYYEGQFHKDQVGYCAANGLTYDGRAINITTGEIADGLHEFSASSKESVHVSMLALALSGNQFAQIFISPEDPVKYEPIAIDILTNKITSYETFNTNFPGFGGFFPWFVNNCSQMTPTSDFASRTPALDNGQLAWSLYAVANVLATRGYTDLSNRYFAQVKMMADNALTVFYDGNGHTRTVAGIKNITGPCEESNYYTTANGYLDDPYEGELFTFFMDLFSTWPTPDEREKVWEYKRALLQRSEFQSPSGNITVQKGWWFSSHEQWKFMVLPYLDVEAPRRVFMNGERARTLFSSMSNTPGLHASTNDVSSTLLIPDYVSDSGITSISFNSALRDDLITPYGAFPVILANFSVGLVWYHNMISGPKMQGPHGSTEAILVNGTLIAPLVTWDTKITTVNAMLGGITQLTGTFMAKDGVLERFQYVAQREYIREFPELNGEDIPFALPPSQIPTNALQDFTLCEKSSK